MWMETAFDIQMLVKKKVFIVLRLFTAPFFFFSFFVSNTCSIPIVSVATVCVSSTFSTLWAG